MNWLSFVASDLHKSFSPLFALEAVSPDKKIQDTVRAWAVGNVDKGLSYLDKHLEGKDYLMGDDFTVADAYAFVVAGWTRWVGISIEGYQNLKKYLALVAERPAVRKVYKEEGLLD
jgi:glutathione S-transferase